MSSSDRIYIKGAREHNLKNIDLELPREKLIVFTGLSGSGKSSLAFDTIYAEGQRRYMESLSSYARQFLGQMEKPDVDYIEGLSPAISIDQKTTSHNPRSTVGTVTEIYDYLRLLFARVGVPYCPICGRVISRQTVDQMIDLIEGLPEGTRISVLAPVVRGRKGEYHQLLHDLYKGGFGTVRVNGQVYSLSDQIELDRYKAHNIEVLIDRLIVGQSTRSRLTEAVESAMKLSKGMVVVAQENIDDEILLSEDLACPYDGFSLGEISPRSFSFNSPYGACEDCHGLGLRQIINEDLIIPDRTLTIADGAIMPWTFSPTNYYGILIKNVAEHFGLSIDLPVKDLDPSKLDKVLNGIGSPIRLSLQYFSGGQSQHFSVWFNGLIPHLENRYKETESDRVRQEIERYMLSTPCQTCHGARLKEEALIFKVGASPALNIAELTKLTIDKAKSFFGDIKLSPRDQSIAGKIILEINSRLEFLSKVGLDYLTLDRSATTLAGGESQRIRLASQIGSALVGILYVLDEPTIGLHPTDNAKLIETLKHLRDLGNTVIVVEHDEETMRAADYLVDIGPGAGEAGGEIVAAGTFEEVLANPKSITAPYLKHEKIINAAKRREVAKGHNLLTVHGARENNLKKISVNFPISRFIVVTGVSGSGKSTLVTEILAKAVGRRLGHQTLTPGAHDSITGVEHINKMIEIDQSPIGRTPRSNPATYTKAFDPIRQLFAATPAARSRGYKPGRFSFNVIGGRCEHCQGDGQIKIEMNFLPDVYITCDVCRGTRYNRETLEVNWKGKTIAQVLNLTIDDALVFFGNIHTIADKLQTLQKVGLGYVRLGQSATTLSGGEAQRIKLAAELAKRDTGQTLYILDEPTTGLHFQDVDKLLGVLQALVDRGNTVVVIEHNLDVIKSADWVIDLGPSGGEKGGRVVATGTPEEVTAVKESLTGQVLDKVLFGQKIVSQSGRSSS